MLAHQRLAEGKPSPESSSDFERRPSESLGKLIVEQGKRLARPLGEDFDGCRHTAVQTPGRQAEEVAAPPRTGRLQRIGNTSSVMPG